MSSLIREISEARLFRKPSDVEKTSIGNLSDTLFACILGLEFLRRVYPKGAVKYASQTILGDSQWKSSGSDLHNMIYVMLNPDKFSDKLKIDRVAYVPELQLKAYLRRVAHGNEDRNADFRFFFMMQKNLKVESPGLKNARRILQDWDTSTLDEKRSVASRLNYVLRKEINQTDFWPIMLKALTRSKLISSDDSDSSTLSKVAIAGAAGYYLGKKAAS